MITLPYHYFVSRDQAARMLRVMRRAQSPGGVVILRGEGHRHYSAKAKRGYVHIAVSAIGVSLRIESFGDRHDSNRPSADLHAQGAV